MSFKITPSHATLPRYLSPFGSNGGQAIQTRPVQKSSHDPVNCNRVVCVTENGEVPPGPIVMFDNTAKPLEVVIKPDIDGSEKKLVLAAMDGLSVVVHTESGSFTLSYPDVDRHIVSYGDMWNMFGWNPNTYKFYPTKISHMLGGIFSEGNAIGFGYSVAISGGGSVAVVGHPELSNGSGGVCVYKKDLEGKLAFVALLVGEKHGKRKDEGKVVVMNSTGSIIGMNSKDSLGNGTFVLFERQSIQDSVWKMAHIFDEECDAAAISSAGTRLALGDAGHIRVYDYDGSSWSLAATLGDGNDQFFGTRIALSGNGRFVASISSESTAVVHDLSFPVPIKHILVDHETVVGLSISIDHTGDTVAVGTDDAQGKICVFSTKMSSDRYGTRPDPNFDRENITNNLYGIGHSISLSVDGNTMMVGAPKYKSGAGAVFVFTRTCGEWVLRSKMVGEEGCVLGYSVALSSAGNTGLVSGIGLSGTTWVVK